MKILHTADWHLDSPIQGRTPEQYDLLRRALLRLPGMIADLCRAENCDMLLLAGDLFDGQPSAESVAALQTALKEVDVPVFITPGNHDFICHNSLWLTETWPENVHIFTNPHMEEVYVECLGCKVYGAGFAAMDCDGLLSGFHAEEGMLSIGILHGDPTQASSPYCPITQTQVADSGLAYLALGHIHKGGAFRSGGTLCAWPGSPMGRGYDEQGEKGVLIVTIEEEATARFVPLDTPKFYDWEVEAGADPAASLNAVLPPVGNEDFYRITLTGESEAISLPDLAGQFARFPNLVLQDKTVPPLDIWRAVGQDSFEGVYFGLLQQALETPDEATRERVILAARICRQLLDGQEVRLP